MARSAVTHRLGQLQNMARSAVTHRLGQLQNMARSAVTHRLGQLGQVCCHSPCCHSPFWPAPEHGQVRLVALEEAAIGDVKRFVHVEGVWVLVEHVTREGRATAHVGQY